MGKKEYDVATRFVIKQRGGLATGGPERRPSPLHYVVVKDGDKGLEVLRVPLPGKGEALPVFSAGWAARGYLFAAAPGGGWYAKSCAPEDRKSTRLNSSHANISYAVFCLKKKKKLPI